MKKKLCRAKFGFGKEGWNSNYDAPIKETKKWRMIGLWKVTVDLWLKTRRRRERKREKTIHTHLRQWCNGDSTDSWFISHIFLFLSLLSASYCFLFFNTIYCLVSYISYFRPSMCVDCDGREIASSFLFMFRSMFYTSRILFAVFSYRLFAFNFSTA